MRGSRCVPKAATAGYVAPKMTMTEGIIARRAGQDSVKPGDNVWIDVDKLMTHDVCGPGTFGIFEKEFGEDAQVSLPHLHWGPPAQHRSRLCRCISCFDIPLGQV